ncbi:MAG TPA: alpha/beta hydrolase [Candidatus Angelobacter sp.]|nr:alpha/beta hydrolase [Candidatus Angelobacter sp.]
MSLLASFFLALDRSAAGLRLREIQVDDHKIKYAEGGRGEAVLLLHGFGAESGNWNRMAKRLTRHYRVIAPDLPGWGRSTRLEDGSYGYPVQVERIHRLVQELGLTRFHLMGHSMGGGIAARYAAKYPDEVMTLGLMAAHGLVEPRESAIRRAIAGGENWLLVSSPQDFQRLVDHLFIHRPPAPRAVVQYLMRQAISRREKNRQIFADMHSTDSPLIDILPQIKAPTLLIWGDEDMLVDVSAVEVFKEKISHAKALVLHSGHMPLVEHGRECAEAYLAFLDEQAKSSPGAFLNQAAKTA